MTAVGRASAEVYPSDRVKRAVCFGCFRGLPVEDSPEEGLIHRAQLGGVEEIFNCDADLRDDSLRELVARVDLLLRTGEAELRSEVAALKAELAAAQADRHGYAVKWAESEEAARKAEAERDELVKAAQAVVDDMGFSSFLLLELEDALASLKPAPPATCSYCGTPGVQHVDPCEEPAPTPKVLCKHGHTRADLICELCEAELFGKSAPTPGPAPPEEGK